MEVIDILRQASSRIYDGVKDLAGTDGAGGDFGMGAGGDVSRNIDMVAEKAVLDYLREVDFQCVVLGEECGRVDLSEDPAGYVIMDAIDGSANAVRGVPFFCSSLAFATGSRLSTVTDGVITNLATGQTYWASSGRGAFLDGRPISVHDRKDDPPYRIVGINTSGATAGLMRRLDPIFENHNHTRHFGANALEMALLAQGLMDAFIDLRDKIRIHDIAAGYLVAREAGGILVGADMRPLDADISYEARISFVAAANRRVLDDMAEQAGMRT